MLSPDELRDKLKKPAKTEPSKTSMVRAIAAVATKVSPTSQTVDYIAEGYGKADFIRAMRLCSEDDLIMQALQVYDHLSPAEQSTVSLDTICEQVALPPDKLSTAVFGALVKNNTQIIKMALSTATPTVLKAGIAEASKPDGLEDRRMVYQMSGLMPFDKGNEININQNFNAMKGVPRFEDAADAEQSSILGEVVPSAEGE